MVAVAARTECPIEDASGRLSGLVALTAIHSRGRDRDPHPSIRISPDVIGRSLLSFFALRCPKKERYPMTSGYETSIQRILHEGSTTYYRRPRGQEGMNNVSILGAQQMRSRPQNSTSITRED